MNKKKLFAAAAALIVLCLVLSGCNLFKSEQKDPVTYNLYYNKSDDYLIGVAATAIESTVEIQTTITTTGKTYAGSGVIIAVSSSRTFIITNSHVVSGENNESNTSRIKVSVRPAGGKDSDYVTATILARTLNDISSDLALISISKKDSHVPATCSFEELSYGQHILAVGNGLGYGTSVCDGLISNPSIYVSSSSFKAYAIQISAPINSGNSGGGLFDMKARLAGINTLKAVADGPDSKTSVYADNISFAIKMSEVKKFIDSYNTGKSGDQRVEIVEAADESEVDTL